jgi:hypothetical protein
MAGVMNIYYSPLLAEHKREDLFRTIESQGETLAQLKKVSERDIKPYRTYFSICLNDYGSITFKRASDKRSIKLSRISASFAYSPIQTYAEPKY